MLKNEAAELFFSVPCRYFFFQNFLFLSTSLMVPLHKTGVIVILLQRRYGIKVAASGILTRSILRILLISISTYISAASILQELTGLLLFFSQLVQMLAPSARALASKVYHLPLASL